MPEKKTIRKSRELKREGKAPTTQAGPFVREEMEHIREGKHGARSTEQAIAIGLSKARRSGVKLPVPAKGTTSEATRKRAATDLKAGERSTRKSTTVKRSRSSTRAMQREPLTAASHEAISKHSKAVARKRASKRTASARKGTTSRTSSRSRSVTKTRTGARQRGD